MMFSSPMVRILAAVLDHDVDKVSSELLKLGVMHFINITEVKREWSNLLSGVDVQNALARTTEIKKRIESILRQVGDLPEVPQNIDLSGRSPLNLDEEEKRVDAIMEELSQIREKQRLIQQEINRVEDIKRQLQNYGIDLSGVNISSPFSFISIKLGKIPKEEEEKLKQGMEEIPSAFICMGEDQSSKSFLLIAMKRDEQRVNKILTLSGWKDLEITEQVTEFREDALQDLDAKLRKLSSEQEALANQALDRVNSSSAYLSDLWIRLRINELLYRIQGYFKKSSRAAFFSGWLPQSRQKQLEEAVKRVTSGRCYLEWSRPREGVETGSVPVQLKNPRFLAPFQMLVTNFGVPQYGTVDPTPFATFFYLIMFGLMFADAGQGAVITLFGILGTFLFRKKETFKKLSWLMVWCGATSIITGVLFGSYFGMRWVQPLVLDFEGIVSGHYEGGKLVQDIFDIMAITIYFGIAVIGLGLLFNWINLSRNREWVKLIFDKGGLMGGWIYGGGIYCAHYMVSHDYKALPPVSSMLFLIIIPAVLMFFKSPIEFFIEKSRNHPGKNPLFVVMDFGMNWIVELLEVFSGYLSNTLSFLRIAGFGIAHVTLMTAFFELARMAEGSSQANFNFWSILILIMGNILVIGLEGLSAGIQSLRLNYYEFFTKFFRGSGEVYSPISLRSRD